MNPQEQAVLQYFDRIASDYHRRYHPSSKYHHYFFTERLESAVQGLEMEHKAILDIGAGTGALYDYLCLHCSAFQYFAVDFSSSMLANSRIPPANRFAGKIEDAALPCAQFDLVFLLGVATYMDEKAFLQTLEFIGQHLRESGKAVISFTHRCSLDFQVRRFLTFFGRQMRLSRRLAGQPFSPKAHCKSELNDLAGAYFKITRFEWLNQTLTPFNQLLPYSSVLVARLLKRTLAHTSFLPFLSADFLVVLEKKQARK